MKTKNLSQIDRIMDSIDHRRQAWDDKQSIREALMFCLFMEIMIYRNRRTV